MHFIRNKHVSKAISSFVIFFGKGNIFDIVQENLAGSHHEMTVILTMKLHLLGIVDFGLRTSKTHSSGRPGIKDKLEYLVLGHISLRGRGFASFHALTKVDNLSSSMARWPINLSGTRGRITLASQVEKHIVIGQSSREIDNLSSSMTRWPITDLYSIPFAQLFQITCAGLLSQTHILLLSFQIYQKHKDSLV
jgi:hypothetical protein